MYVLSWGPGDWNGNNSETLKLNLKDFIIFNKYVRLIWGIYEDDIYDQTEGLNIIV